MSGFFSSPCENKRCICTHCIVPPNNLPVRTSIHLCCLRQLLQSSFKAARPMTSSQKKKHCRVVPLRLERAIDATESLNPLPNPRNKTAQELRLNISPQAHPPRALHPPRHTPNPSRRLGACSETAPTSHPHCTRSAAPRSPSSPRSPRRRSPKGGGVDGGVDGDSG